MRAEGVQEWSFARFFTEYPVDPVKSGDPVPVFSANRLTGPRSRLGP